MNKIDKDLLDILVCPVTKDKLLLDEEKNELISKEAKLAYPIRDGIPIMLPEEARKLDYILFEPGLSPKRRLGRLTIPPSASLINNLFIGFTKFTNFIRFLLKPFDIEVSKV